MSEVLAARERVDPVTAEAVTQAVEQQIRTIALAALETDRTVDWTAVRVEVTDVGAAAWISTAVPLREMAS